MNWTLDINGNQLSYEVPAFKGQYLLVTFLPNLPSENFKENSVNLQRHHGDYNLGLDDSVTSDFIYVSSRKLIAFLIFVAFAKP